MRSFYRIFFARFFLVVFGLFAGAALVELTCFGLLKAGYSADDFAPTEAPPLKPLTYAYEVPAALEKLPWIKKDFGPDTYEFDAYTRTVPHWASDNEMFYGKKNYSGEMTMTRKSDGQVIYSAQVTIDGHRRRLTHSPSEKDTRQLHLLMMGCSFIWGDWLGDHETLPWQLHQKQNTFSVYNLGFSGYHPSLTYRMIEKYAWLDGVQQKKGVAYYFITSFHIDRFLANLAGIGTAFQPIYVPDGRGDFRFVGREAYRRSLRAHLQNIYSHTKFYKLFNISWPRANPENYENFARMLKKIENKYKEAFTNDSEFYVVFYPFPTPPADLAMTKTALDKLQIKFIDFTGRDYLSFSKESTMLIDQHPNALANQFIADALIEQLSTPAPSSRAVRQWSATKN